MKQSTGLALAVKKKRSFAKFGNIFIIAIALLTNTSTVTAQTSSDTTQEEAYQIIEDTFVIQKPEKVLITGRIKDRDGNPLSNALVTTVLGNSFPSDSTGSFSITLKREEIFVQNIFASYKGLVTGVRSYSPAMVNADYDITLYKPVKCCPLNKSDSPVIKPLNIHIKNMNGTLTEKTQKELSDITKRLKENPEKKIVITAYPGPDKSKQRLANETLSSIKRYLIEHDGISSDRIRIRVVTDAGNKEGIDISIE